MEWPWARLHALSERMSAFENSLDGEVFRRIRRVLSRYDTRMDNMEARIEALERMAERIKRRRDAA